ncbi:MAG: YpdA family putative bacillithiol disulfide reductase [Thermoanaerobaculia bacterium]
MILLDLLVVGAGPVGIACAIEARRQGLSTLVVEKGALLNTLVSWPKETVFFSTPELLEIGQLPFVTRAAKPTRREGLVYYRKAAERSGLAINLYERVTGISREESGFRVTTSKETYAARHVVVATGFFDHPNPLGVPGEELPKVSHYYSEPFPYAGTDVLVVGGKNSAAEAALDLHRNGAHVTMAVRKAEFGASVKYWLKPDLENRVKEGSIKALFGTVVTAIESTSVSLKGPGGPFELRNDFVLALTGYHPDFDFLSSIGVEVTGDGHLVHDPDTMESGVPGLYLAGVVAAGVSIGKLFIENGRNHAVQIVQHILSRRGESPRVPLHETPLRRFQDGD